MKTFRAMLLLVLPLLSGCLSGRLYYDVVEPLSVNFRAAPVGSKQCVLPLHRVKEPVSGYGISAEWDVDSIVTRARKAGISTIYYADIRTFSILSDLYSRKDIIIYGA